jgi:hypothetical protein
LSGQDSESSTCETPIKLYCFYIAAFALGQYRPDNPYSGEMVDRLRTLNHRIQTKEEQIAMIRDSGDVPQRNLIDRPSKVIPEVLDLAR